MRRCRSPWSSRSRPRSGRSPIRASRSWRRGSTNMSVVAIPHTAVRTAPRNLGDRVLRSVLRLAAVILVLLVAAIVIEMLRTALPAMHKFGWRFLTTSTWDPVAERFGVLPFVYGTVVSSLLALGMAVPLGIG